MNTEQQRQFLAKIRKCDPETMNFDEWRELHGMLVDLVHCDDVNGLRVALEALEAHEVTA